MEVRLQMVVQEEGVDFGRLPFFMLLGLYPGAMRKNFRNGHFWLEWMDDKSVLPIANLMESAFRLNRLVVFKKPDNVTQKLIQANLSRTRLDASIHVSIHTPKKDVLWQGDYEFDFFIERLFVNQSDEEGNKWETMQLKILDGTEKLSLER